MFAVFFMFTVTPLDVVKIRLQAQKNPFPKGMHELLSVQMKSDVDVVETSYSFFDNWQENVLCTVMA